MRTFKLSLKCKYINEFKSIIKNLIFLSNKYVCFKRPQKLKSRSRALCYIEAVNLPITGYTLAEFCWLISLDI